jgi:hypothetical protein
MTFDDLLNLILKADRQELLMVLRLADFLKVLRAA